MKNVGVIFGSRSVEHDVSIVTALQFIENMDKTKYKPIPLYIDKEGEWYTGEKLLKVETFKNFDKNDKEIKRVVLSPEANKKEIYYIEKSLMKEKKVSIDIDVIVPALHGMNGEDGTIAGLLELANIPYTSAGLVGSSVGMDKIIMKAFFKGAGFPVIDYIFFLRDEWKQDEEKVIEKIESKLKYPMFVKPSNLGSSIGISKAKNKEELKNAIEVAINYDRKIIVENGVEDIMEINCSAMGYGNEILASVCEEPVNWEEFLTFEDKYIRDGGKSKGMATLDRKIPAPISEELTEKIRGMSKNIFRELDCKGVVRIDYIINKSTEELYVNEINTIPGSFAFYLWEPLGIKYPELIDKLIVWAEEAHKEKNNNIYSFESKILNNPTGAKVK